MSFDATEFVVRDASFPTVAVTERRQDGSYFPGRRRRCAPEEVLYREGEDVRAIYCVRDGLIKLFTHFESGRRRPGESRELFLVDEERLRRECRGAS